MPYYVDLDKKINVMLRTELYGDIGVCEMSIRQYLDNVGAELPAEDVRPVVRGRWVLDSDPGEPWRYVCDQCGEVTKDTCMGKPRAAFCQMCGADMREV